MAATLRYYHHLKRVLSRLVAPLRADDSMKQFTLAVPEAQTTTVDSVQGWGKRPPAALRCPGCEGELVQHDPIDKIDCQDCWRSFDGSTFSEHELLRMHCPRCGRAMDYGTRHPDVFDIPEYATCPGCQYHWDLAHWF